MIRREFANRLLSPGRWLPCPEVSAHPTPAEINRAKTLILEDLLGDFPFVSPADRAHAVAALLCPFVRELIDGPTPMHLIEAPKPGTGKTVLAHLVAMPASGRSADTLTEGWDEVDWRRCLTSVLLSDPMFILIDNMQRRLESAALAAALTERTWQYRPLRRSELERISLRAIWLATANNPMLKTEISRRVVRIRLDAKVARPWLRTGFRHTNILAWADEQRSDLTWAALTLVQSWVAVGMVPGAANLGGYESWSEVMGGILDRNGIGGFLGNVEGADDCGAPATQAEEIDVLRRERETFAAAIRGWDRYRNSDHGKGPVQSDVLDAHNAAIALLDQESKGQRR